MLNLLSQKENTGSSTNPCSIMLLKTGGTPLTEIAGYDIPKMPSNCTNLY
jgi:hypothetical protein